MASNSVVSRSPLFPADLFAGSVRVPAPSGRGRGSLPFPWAGALQFCMRTSYWLRTDSAYSEVLFRGRRAGQGMVAALMVSSIGLFPR